AMLRAALPARRLRISSVWANPETVCNLASQSSATHVLPTGLRILRSCATWLRNPPRRTSCPPAYDFIRMGESGDRLLRGFAILRGARPAHRIVLPTVWANSERVGYTRSRCAGVRRLRTALGTGRVYSR